MEDDEINKLEEAAIKYGKFMNPDDFLEWEFRQQEKHEYIEGAIITMQGASANHNIIQSNIIGSLWSKFNKTLCSVVGSDLKVFVKAKESYFYPDALIFCGDPEYADTRKHVITNPKVIFEILSPSTENYDLGKKFFIYMQVESIKEIIFISSTSAEIKAGRRQPDNSWKFEIITNLNESLFIESINTYIPLGDIFLKTSL